MPLTLVPWVFILLSADLLHNMVKYKVLTEEQPPSSLLLYLCTLVLNTGTCADYPTNKVHLLCFLQHPHLWGAFCSTLRVRMLLTLYLDLSCSVIFCSSAHGQSCLPV